MSQSVTDVLRRASLYSDGRIYRALKLPPNAITLAAGVVAEIGLPFCALIVDKDEVTLMMPDEARNAYSARLRDAIASEREYRLITLDAALDPGLVGLMAQIATTLAEARIPILTFAAYSRDHIFVSGDDFEEATRRLELLQAECG